MEDYIDTDNIFKKMREFEESKFEKPLSIKLNPIDIRYLKSNVGFAPIGDMVTIMGMKVIEDDNIKIGECILQ